MKKPKNQTRWSKLGKKWRWTIGLLILIVIIVAAYVLAYEVSKLLPSSEPPIQYEICCYQLEFVEAGWEGYPDGIDVWVTLKLLEDYERFKVDFNMTLKNGDVYNETRQFLIQDGYTLPAEVTQTFHFPIIEDIDVLRIKVYDCS